MAVALVFALTGCDGCNDGASGATPSASATASIMTGSAAASAAAAASSTPPEATDAAATTDGPPGASGTALAVPPATGTAPTTGTAVSTAAPAATSTDSAAAVATGPGPEPTSPPPVLEPAEPGSADALAAEVDAVYAPIGRFRSRFEQTYQAKVAGVTKKSTGTLLVERPGKLSFRYDPPNNNRVVSDGATIRIYEADNNQLLEQPVGKTEYPGALAFLMGHGMRGSFRFTFNDKAKFDGGKVLLGTPRVTNPAYEQVLFYIDQALLAKRDPGTVRRVVVLDVQRNKNRFDFLEASMPDRVEPSEFVFTPPPGTNVVR